VGAAVGLAVGTAVGVAVSVGEVTGTGEASVGVNVGLVMVAASGFLGGGATIATMTMSTTKAATAVTVHHFHDRRGFHQGVLAVLPGGAVGGGQGGGEGGGSCDIFQWPETETAAAGGGQARAAATTAVASVNPIRVCRIGPTYPKLLLGASGYDTPQRVFATVRSNKACRIALRRLGPSLAGRRWHRVASDCECRAILRERCTDGRAPSRACQDAQIEVQAKVLELRDALQPYSATAHDN
jgi:hypothetical protein